MKNTIRLIQRGLLGGILILFTAGNVLAQDTEVFIPRGHNNEVLTVAYSPDGRYVVSGSHDHTIKLWEANMGLEIRSFVGHTSGVRSVAFSPDGRHVLSGSSDKTMRLWEVSTGRLVQTFSGHEKDVFSVDFSPDGRYVLSGSWDRTLKLWETATGRVVRTFTGHKSNVSSVAFSPDGRYILSGSWDRTLKLWEAATGRMVRTFTGHRSFVNSVAFSPDGKYGLSGSGNFNSEYKSLKLWEINTGRERWTIFGGEYSDIRNVTFSSDGQYVLSNGKKMKLYETSTGRMIRTFDVAPNSCALSPDGESIISGHFNGTLKRWDIESDEEILTFTGHSQVIQSLAVSADGKYVVSGDRDGYLKLLETGTGREIWSKVINKSGIQTVAYSPDGQYVLSGVEVSNSNGDKGLKLLEAGTGRELWSFDFNANGDRAPIGEVAFSPDGRTILVGSGYRMKLWEIASRRELQTFAEHNGITSLAFSPDGRYVVSGSLIDNTLKLWEVRTGAEIRTFVGHNERVRSVTFSPDGRYILSGSGFTSMFSKSNSSDKTMRLWDVSTGRLVRTFSGYNYDVLSVAFTPDGRYALFGSEDHTLKLWEIATGRMVRTFKGHSSKVNSVVFSQDGHKVISGSMDGTVRIWDWKTGEELAQIYSGSGEWIVKTPEGYYDASDNGAKFLNVRMGNETFPMDNFFETYYRPDIVRAKLAGEDISPLIDSDIRNVTAHPPAVRFISPGSNTTSNKPQLTLTTEVTDRGGGIDEVRLFHNGKVVSSDTRGLKVVSGGNTLNPEFEVNLLPGENVFRLIAFSEGDRIESNPATLSVNYEGAKSNTRLFTLVIGINEYKNPKYSLNYARSDASGFEERIIKGGESIFDEVVQTTITDADATKQNIFAALDKIKAVAGPEDMFVFYYAGHGVMSDPMQGSSEFFMAPTDVTQLYGNEALLKSRGIAASEIQEYSKNIKAQKQLFVLDACQSGGATEMLAMRGATEEKAIAQLARSTGTFWLTASGSEQFATEFATLGHGVFTYALLEGLNGKADQGAKDKKITVQELSAFLNDRVPELTQIHKGQAQYPSSYGYGQDFPISIVSQ